MNVREPNAHAQNERVDLNVSRRRPFYFEGIKEQSRGTKWKENETHLREWDLIR